MNNLHDKNKNSFSGNELLNATISFLVVGIVYFPFVLPWMLWKKSVRVLSSLHQDLGILKTISESRNSFFAWLQYFLDALVFFSYIGGPVLIIVWTSNHGLQGFIKSFLLFYFLPIFFHIIKEIFSVFIQSPLNKNEKGNNFSN